MKKTNIFLKIILATLIIPISAMGSKLAKRSKSNSEEFFKINKNSLDKAEVFITTVVQPAFYYNYAATKKSKEKTKKTITEAYDCNNFKNLDKKEEEQNFFLGSELSKRSKSNSSYKTGEFIATVITEKKINVLSKAVENRCRQTSVHKKKEERKIVEIKKHKPKEEQNRKIKKKTNFPSNLNNLNKEKEEQNFFLETWNNLISLIKSVSQ